MNQKLIGLVVAQNAAIVGAAIYDGGSLSGLIHLRRTHRSPKRLADIGGLRIRKGDSVERPGQKDYWVSAGQDHPLAGRRFATLDGLRATIIMGVA